MAEKRQKWRDILDILISAVFSGMLISVGSTVYLRMENKVIGAFLFSVGLITIVIFRMKLYTGAVGNAETLSDFAKLPVMILGNLIGSACMLLWGVPSSQEMFEAKLANPLYLTFFRGVLCGILIYIAVTAYRMFGVQGLPITSLAVAVFILTGAEHSIADMCYMFACQNYSLRTWLFLLVVILGNGVGAWVLGCWVRYTERKQKN